MSTLTALSHNTVLQSTLFKESAKYKDSIDIDFLLEYPDDTFKDGNVCFRTIPKTKAFQELLNENRIVAKDRNPNNLLSAEHYDIAMNNITSTIITINKAGTIKECLNKINKIKVSLEERFYGALLIDDKTILNPLHPLTAMSLLSANELTSKTIFKLVIYAYSSIEEKENLFEKYEEHRACKDRIDKNINNQLLIFTNTVPTKIQRLPEDNTSNLNYKINKVPGEYPDEECYIVAHQILTKGIIMPYYGTSLIKLGNTTSGTYLTPMWSCNISSNCTIGLDEWVNTSCEFPKIVFRSVCTGSLDNKTLKGIRTLTHSNASSPYTHRIMHTGALTYAAACVDKSLEIYIRANIIKEIPNEKTCTTNRNNLTNN